jgi:hypothetical protein
MKYLEELNPGVLFSYNETYWVVTSDFKKNGDRMCISIKDGFPSWMSSNTTVQEVDGYVLDANNNFVAIRSNTDEKHNIS